MTTLLDVNEASFDAEVLQSDRPVLVDFWAPWCGPCMALLPAIEALAPMYEDRLKVVKINADENPALMERFGVRGIPQLFLINGGETVGSIKERTRTRLSVELDTALDNIAANGAV
ncbi:thiol reductase thioredoxin [Sphingobium lactosutens]|uniref:thioredoxin family protein n=1 Tax=Sphingobium lactosutens TaxID=522773 RepID=UPI0015BD4D4F|nr:thioredoxin domain-containing protein [Sphingobium lactosutens]NWK94588.1 thiol reductase thioredoxin [Sphingobium lactosutens]